MKKWITEHGITVYRLESPRCNCFAIVTEQEKWLVDTSTMCCRYRIQKQLEACGIYELTGIILTHSHINHVEAAAWFAQEYACPVYVHDSELHFVQTGDCLIPNAASPSMHWIEKLVAYVPFLNKYPACREAQALKFEEPLIWNEHIKLLETPGHSEGSISILIDEELAIVGDMMKRSGASHVRLMWANQPGLVEVSWKKLLQEECEWFLPSHGREISKKMVEKEVYRKEKES